MTPKEKENPENFDDNLTQVAPKEKEFNLSNYEERRYTGDVIEGCEEWYPCFDAFKVKEFIRLLKKFINSNSTTGGYITQIGINKVINKLAGEKLK